MISRCSAGAKHLCKHEDVRNCDDGDWRIYQGLCEQQSRLPRTSAAPPSTIRPSKAVMDQMDIQNSIIVIFISRRLTLTSTGLLNNQLSACVEFVSHGCHVLLEVCVCAQVCSYSAKTGRSSSSDGSPVLRRSRVPGMSHSALLAI